MREARSKVRREGRSLRLADLETMLAGQRPKVSAELRRRTAIHEAGHAVVRHVLGIGRVTCVTIATTGSSGGYVEAEEDVVDVETEERLMGRLAIWLAGRAAEQVILGSVSAGAGGAMAATSLRRPGSPSRWKPPSASARACRCCTSASARQAARGPHAGPGAARPSPDAPCRARRGKAGRREQAGRHRSRRTPARRRDAAGRGALGGAAPPLIAADLSPPHRLARCRNGDDRLQEPEAWRFPDLPRMVSG